MRGTSCLFVANGRKPAREPFPFVEILPLRLKPRIAGKGSNIKENICLHEMSVLLACLKKHDFKQPLCDKEIMAFQKCQLDVMKQRSKVKEQEIKGEVTLGSKGLSVKEINKVLKQYPPN